MKSVNCTGAMETKQGRHLVRMTDSSEVSLLVRAEKGREITIINTGRGTKGTVGTGGSSNKVGQRGGNRTKEGNKRRTELRRGIGGEQN